MRKTAEKTVSVGISAEGKKEWEKFGQSLKKQGFRISEGFVRLLKFYNENSINLLENTKKEIPKTEKKKKYIINLILYICNKLLGYNNSKIKTDFHKVFKIIYRADQIHIAQNGIPITFDTYIAMKYGPVPSAAYEILKAARGESILAESKGFTDFFSIKDHVYIFPKENCDLSMIIPSIRKILDEAIEEFKEINFTDLTTKTHGEAYNKANKYMIISWFDIAKEGGANKEVLDFVKSIKCNCL